MADKFLEQLKRDFRNIHKIGAGEFEDLEPPIIDYEPLIQDCLHPREAWEEVDTRQAVEYWGGPKEIGARWVICNDCSEDITDIADAADKYGLD